MDFICSKNAPEWFADGIPVPSLLKLPATRVKNKAEKRTPDLGKESAANFDDGCWKF